MDVVRSQARAPQPKMIIAGYSAYPRVIDFAAFAEIAKEIGAIFMVDMAHFAGLSATGVYPSPVPFADVVTTTTHQTPRGPRGGVILRHAEDASRPARGDDPLQGRAPEGDRQERLPRRAGRSAGARHRREGGVVPRG